MQLAAQLPSTHRPLPASPPAPCDRRVLLFMLLGPNAVAGALGVPVLTIAIKR